ncbi:MAG: hypothetical protein HY287_03505 [Planctomycetes bacterium]|nr:hypothetical protein [Planctomycetota bacterium]MBI3833377.1 hypothetical protein [Planctomycetota bacterium]
MREIRNKPEGGYCIVAAFEVAWILCTYKAGFIRWYDVRVWFACKEAAARRCGLRNGRSAKYRVEEICSLVGGVNGGCVRAALRRLEATGLFRFGETAIRFATSPDELRIGDLSGFWSMVHAIGQKNRKVPIPRRIVRYIAGGMRKTLAGTLLGHVLRCCYLNGAEYLSEGSCSASWVARVFDLDERHVKRARKHLAEIGLLSAVESDSWHRKKYGARFAVSPTWSDSVEQPRERIVKRPPRSELSTNKRPPLLILKENSFGIGNQKPALAADRPTGVCTQRGASAESPTMRHVTTDDIRDTRRLVGAGGLFDDAVRRGLVNRCEADRLKFVAAAERAVREATRNPGGFFVRLVRAKLWHYITLEQEDAARRRLRRVAEEDGRTVERCRGSIGPPWSDELAHACRDAGHPDEQRRVGGELEVVRELIARSLALAAEVQSIQSVDRETGHGVERSVQGVESWELGLNQRGRQGRGQHSACWERRVA